ncbi:MAG: NirD/YgiW/YdeI family stress tolerance protein [Desulfovibrio sp.]|nr:NirD/YgiW/YdeI family stress tolerance protein [Desulfovibrio sp.]
MRALIMIALICLLAIPAQAAYTGPGAVANSTTVQAAKKMSDDSRVALTGNIVSRIGDDKYLFRDGTGDIIVEIDDEDFGGQDVSAQNTVIIIGEVDKDFGRDPEIDAKALKVIK